MNNKTPSLKEILHKEARIAGTVTVLSLIALCTLPSAVHWCTIDQKNIARAKKLNIKIKNLRSEMVDLEQDYYEQGIYNRPENDKIEKNKRWIANSEKEIVSLVGSEFVFKDDDMQTPKPASVQLRDTTIHEKNDVKPKTEKVFRDILSQIRLAILQEEHDKKLSKVREITYKKNDQKDYHGTRNDTTKRLFDSIDVIDKDIKKLESAQ